jgi:hypothetical protein
MQVRQYCYSSCRMRMNLPRLIKEEKELYIRVSELDILCAQMCIVCLYISHLVGKRVVDECVLVLPRQEKKCMCVKRVCRSFSHAKNFEKYTVRVIVRIFKMCMCK